MKKWLNTWNFWIWHIQIQLALPLFSCCYFFEFQFPPQWKGLSQWLSSKKSACKAGDVDSITGSGRSPEGGHGKPLQYFCLENLMDRGAWWAAAHMLQRVGYDWSNWARRHQWKSLPQSMGQDTFKRYIKKELSLCLTQNWWCIATVNKRSRLKPMTYPSSHARITMLWKQKGRWGWGRPTEPHRRTISPL